MCSDLCSTIFELFQPSKLNPDAAEFVPRFGSSTLAVPSKED